MPRNSACQKCDLYKTCKNVCIWGAGPTNAKVMIVGRDPGAEEDAQGTPFVGQAGRLLTEWIHIAGLRREDVYITNICKCLEGTSLVKLGDGKTKKIRDLVNEKYSGDVLSFDIVSNTIVKRKVTGWYKTPLNGRKVYKLSTSVSKNNTKGSVGIRATEDHPILTQRGWVKLGELKKTDLVATGDMYPSGNVLQVILGTLLGDATIPKDNAYMSFSHCLKQKEYASYKAQILEQFSPTETVINNSSQNGKFSKQLKIVTAATRAFSSLRSEFYTNGKKIIPRKLMELLDYQGIATWIMDDGYFHIHTHGKNKKSYRLELMTCCFSLEDVKFLKKWFELKGFACSIDFHSSPKDKKYPILRFHSSSCFKLLERCAKYFPECMRYKLPDEISSKIQFDSSTYIPDSPTTLWATPILKEMKPESKTVFCIDVDGTHNFATIGAVVHNCRPPNNRNTTDLEKEACLSYLEEEIAEVKPEFIVALGADALKTLTNRSQITQLVGTFVESKKYNIPVYVSFHPSFILRRQDIKPRAEIHWQNLRERTIGEVKEKAVTNYVYADTYEKATKLLEVLKTKDLLTFDLEATGLDFLTDRILCYSFSWKEGTAVLLPMLGYKEAEIWTEEQKKVLNDGLKDLFAQPHITWIAHNISYDHKMLMAKGITIAGPIRDTMVLSNLIDENATDLRGLKALAKLYTDLGEYDSEVENVKVQLRSGLIKEKNETKDKFKTQLKELKKQLSSLSDLAPAEETKELQKKIRDLEYEIEEYNEETKSLAISYADIPVEILWPYAATDADATYRIYKLFMAKLQEESDNKVAMFGKDMVKLFTKIVMPLRVVLNEMEFLGSKLDVDHLKELDTKYVGLTFELEKELAEFPEIKSVVKKLKKKEADRLKERYDKLKVKKHTLEEYQEKHATDIEFNMNSSEQLCILLYDVLKLKPFKWGNPSKKDGKTRPSADSEVLEKFADAHPAITKLMENRDTQKLHSTYVLGMMKRMDANYRIHTDFNQHITVTGRLSSSNPNLQNIPRANKDIKKAFITDPGYSLIQFDFSQAEFRFWAVYSNDPKMMEDIKNGVDIHKVTASEFYGVPEKDVTKEMRNAAKTIVFGLMYGRGAAAVSKQVGLSEDDAKKIINNFFAKYPVAARWLKQIQMFAKQHGYVPTEFGRVRRLPAVYSGNKEEEAEAMRQATNSPIQGGVADLTGIGLIKIHRRLRERGLRARMLLTVHDSIVVECPDEELYDTIVTCYNAMTEPLPGIVVPFGAEVEAGRNWGDLTTMIAKEKTLDNLQDTVNEYLRKE